MLRSHGLRQLNGVRVAQFSRFNPNTNTTAAMSLRHMCGMSPEIRCCTLQRTPLQSSL